MKSDQEAISHLIKNWVDSCKITYLDRLALQDLARRILELAENIRNE